MKTKHTITIEVPSKAAAEKTSLLLAQLREGRCGVRSIAVGLRSTLKSAKIA